MMLTIPKLCLSCVLLVLLNPVAATHDPDPPSNRTPEQHPSADHSFLPHWANFSGLYDAIVSLHGSTKCSSAMGFQGVCQFAEECTSRAGVFRSSTKCSRQGQVCCSVGSPKPIATCNQQVEASGVHFVNAPDGKLTEICGAFVRIPPSVCKVRLDFLAFKVSQPTLDMEDKTRCIDDVFSVHTGSDSVAYPNICGDNDNQHMLIDVKESDQVFLSMRLAPYAVGITRYWNIKITFEKCDSPDLAPPGCLQRYTTSNGAVRPFNFGPSNQLIEGLKYQVCLIPRADTCQIFVNNRLYNIRGPVFLNMVAQGITSVSIGALFATGASKGILPIRRCRKRLGKSMQARQSAVKRARMRYSVEENTPELLKWLTSASVKSFDRDYIKNAERIEQTDDAVADESFDPPTDIDPSPTIARNFAESTFDGGSATSGYEAVRAAVDSLFGARSSDGKLHQRNNGNPKDLATGRRLTETFSQFVLEVPVRGITPSLRRVLDEDHHVNHLLRTHDHPEHNGTIIPEHPDREWIQQLHEQHTQAVLEKLNEIAQNHASGAHHGSSGHHGTLEHHTSSEHPGIPQHPGIPEHPGISQHPGIPEHPGIPQHHGASEHHGTLCHSGLHEHDAGHSHIPPCPSTAEETSTASSAASATPAPPAEVFGSSVQSQELVIDSSADENKNDMNDDDPASNLPPLIVEVDLPGGKAENSTAQPEPTCNGFKLGRNLTEACLKEPNPEKCFFNSVHSLRGGINDDVSRCNYTASELASHRLEFEQQALQQYHALTHAIHAHPSQTTHGPQNGGTVHPTHVPHSGAHQPHAQHSGHHNSHHHPHHPSVSTKPDGAENSTKGKEEQLVVPVLVYVPVKATIFNQFDRKRIYQVSGNLTKLLEQSLMNSSPNQFLIEIGDPRPAGEGQPELMTFNRQFELLYNFEKC